MTKFEKFMKTLKTVAKYTTNIMAMANALLLVLDPIWGIPYADKISATLIGVTGVIGAYLTGDKAFTAKKSK